MTPVVEWLLLSHFRSHHLVELRTDGRPVALFGPNGAGKTNILEAISMLSPGRGLRRATAAEIARRPEAIGWKIRASLSGRDVQTWSESGAARQLRIDDKAAPQSDLGRMASILWLVPSMDRLWIEGAEGRRRFLDRAVLSFEPGHGEAVLTYEKAMRERNRLLKDQISDGQWYGALEAQMAEAGARIQRARLRTIDALVAAQGEAETAFPAADLALLDPDGAVCCDPDEIADHLRQGRTRDMSAGRTLSGAHRSDLEAIWRAKATPARDCSTGEQKALLISLILANARALERPPIILLDEVAAHLDAERRAALYEEVCALRVQAFMTGTGPELFSELGARAQMFEVTETGGRSQITEAS